MSLTLTNARLVLDDAVVHGTLTVRDNLIAALDTGVSRGLATDDLDGDLLLPGLVDLHSDHLEQHLVPRPGVEWPPALAVLSHDAQAVAAGITTMLDCVALVGVKAGVDRGTACRPMVAALDDARARDRLRADHLLHLRCEVTEPDVLERAEPFRAHQQLRLISLMDHTPGERVFPDVERWRAHQLRTTGMSLAELDVVLERRRAGAAEHAPRNRMALAAIARERGLALATHDDTTAAHVAMAVGEGCGIAEFPTTAAAAELARTAGMVIAMGAPNLVRGASHTGNLAAREAAARGLLDVLASDYVPGGLLHGVMALTREPLSLPLPRAVATAAGAAARACGLDDRGRLAHGLRADLVQVHLDDGVPVVRRVWRGGRRVH